MKKIDVYETDNARRYRVSEFPFLDLVNARRALINAGYLDNYTAPLHYVRVSADQTGGRSDQLIIYVKNKDKAASRVTLSGSIVIDGLRISEVRPDGQ